MGKNVLIGAGVLIVAIVAYLMFVFFYQTRQLSPREQITYQRDGIMMVFDYCSPSKKGRIIFGDDPKALQPYGEYWRMGANQATKFSTTADVFILENRLPPGSYAIYAIPGAENWIIAFHKKADRWGARPPNLEDDVFRLQLPVDNTSSETEQLTFAFVESGNDREVLLTMKWDVVALQIPITY